MIAVIKNNTIWFPEYMNSVHDQGINISRDHYYNNFIFIAFAEVANLPFVHHHFKSFKANVVSSRNATLGIYIDVLGSVNVLKTRVSVTDNDPAKGTQLVSTPVYLPVDIAINNGEWNIIAGNPSMHDYCAALLYLGDTPLKAISKTLAAMGQPNSNRITSLSIEKCVKKLEKTYNKTDNPNEEEILLDLIRKPIKSLE